MTTPTIKLDVQGVLGAGGRIAQRHPQYEARPQQLEMAHGVAKAIAGGHHLIVEAGTGTGKSYAYLVPAILAATANQGEAGVKKRIVVSTHTISLQEQLIERDIPFLNAVLPVEFSAVLVKGRSNYVSLRRLRGAVQRAGSTFSRPEEVDQLQELLTWSRKTTDGSLGDLDFKPISQVWDEAASDSGNCLGKNCPTYNDCFYYKARRRVWNADVMVVNHALFFSDLAIRREGASILPNYDVVILDEAHTVEQVAADHLGLSITSGQLEYLLNRLYQDRQQKGLLARDELRTEQRRVGHLRGLVRDLFDQVRYWKESRGGSNGRVKSPISLSNEVSPALKELALGITQFAQQLQKEEEQIEFLAAADRCDGHANTLNAWLQQTAEGSVYWIEQSGNDGTRVRLMSAPVDVGPVLRDELFNKVPSVILTSATLATGRDSFQFIRERLGLTKADELKLGSPFNFREQAKLVLADGMPDPAGEPSAYESAAIERIKRYLDWTKGRAFVLFTSYKLLQNCARRLTPWLTQRNYGLYVQGGDMPRGLLLEKFRKDPAGVLFGTDSFWQGVDVPGDALQNVIITKLPFSVPDHPLLEARVEAIRDRGGNPFMEYQVPEAVIKLKQGFGRLIRTRTDTGMVAILDPRVRSKPYGRTFLESLPECELIVDP